MAAEQQQQSHQRLQQYSSDSSTNEAAKKSTNSVDDNDSGSSRDNTADANTKTEDDSMNQPGPSPQGESDNPKKKSSVLSWPLKFWRWLDLDFHTVMMMLKGSLPTTICIAYYQSNVVSKYYNTLGYLTAVIAILSLSIMPRGKYIQTILVDMIYTCVAAAVNMFGLWFSVKARENTTPAGQPLEGYNASQSAVCCLWLVFQIYVVNVIRSARPQLQFPSIIYCIYAIITMTYGPQFHTVEEAEDIVVRMIISFFTGFAFSTVVCLLFYPVSSRTIIFKEMNSYLGLLGGVMKSHTAYMQSLEHIDPLRNRGKEGGIVDSMANPIATPAGATLKSTVAKLFALHGKVALDLKPAKRDFAFGKLDASNLTEIWTLLRTIFIPILGITAMTDILERRTRDALDGFDSRGEEEKRDRLRQIESLNWTMQQLREPFARLTGDFQEAFKHVAIVLGWEKQPKTKGDEESKGDTAQPGTAGFSEVFKRKVDDFYASKPDTLRRWCSQRDIKLPRDFFDDEFEVPDDLKIKDETVREKYQRNLFFVLYLEYLLYRSGYAILELVLYADGLKQDGTLTKWRFIFPCSRDIYKFFRAMFVHEDIPNDSQIMSDMDQGGTEMVYMGDAFNKRKDPEHLPAVTWFEKAGEWLRVIPKFFRSKNSAFALRVAAATMVIALINTLRNSQSFFIRERILWAEIMVSFSMNRLAGQSTFNFFVRIIGTIIATVAAFVIWYIVDGHPAGVIVFLWLWMTLSYYVVIRVHKWVVIGILMVLTPVLSVGYELDLQKIGPKLQMTNGQTIYPIYIVAPIRALCVIGGLFVAYVFTIWPYPISEGTEIRKDLGANLYLLANYYSIAHETIGARVKDHHRNESIKGTHAYRLGKARNRVFAKAMTLLSQCRTNSGFHEFQVKVGGRFPAKEYENLIECSQRILNYITLMTYASATYTHDEGPSSWSSEFRRLYSSVHATNHDITSLLCLLSSSLLNAQPLPPYLMMPKSFHFIRKLEAMDHDILSIRHIAEPEYAALAVIQISSQCLVGELEQLTK
ncbi:hypothetical protein K431DRAFT_298064 [Polychaeton citri CBS 116435]|uniref:ER transporter 6TM N-terminal domain-containing protein n=1 Tax=Polychaeton citri CBS 116435 TaxID=1314669 RepID=A0A9P4Q0B4_9PEZI|nr:hypothetical protein K431DRAFT_298064 [Polychaeton citri CBS 116435]